MKTYFYHSDHLGSIGFVTDADAKPVQHLQYLPFGELFVSQMASSFDSRYKFTGKERDEETGYDYFGARYYDSDLSQWLSVDPMSDKYPSLSPYMYCAGNPVILVDPDGRTTKNPDWVEKTDAEGNKTKVNDPNVHSSADINPASGDKYLGKTYKEGNKYYSLFGEIKDLRTNEGKLYEKLDQAFINYANFVKEYNQNTWEDPSESSTDFNIGLPFRKNALGFSDYNNYTFNYEGATGYYFVYGDPYAMKGRLDWGSNKFNGNKNYGFGNMKPGYNVHLYVVKSPTMDVVTLVFPTLSSKNALYQKWQNIFFPKK